MNETRITHVGIVLDLSGTAGSLQPVGGLVVGSVDESTVAVAATNANVLLTPSIHPFR